jgi:hypothetical protein
MKKFCQNLILCFRFHTDDVPDSEKPLAKDPCNSFYRRERLR